MAYRAPEAFFSFVSHQLRVHPPAPTEGFTGQTVIVTGGNTGLGLEAANHIVRLGAEKVILAVRTVSKGEEAKKYIGEKTGRTDVAEVWELDLASYDSVKAFVKKAESLPRLDAVLENAGMLSPVFNMAGSDELVLTVNLISTFLLALMILPKLRESATKFGITPRITIVTSFLHHFAGFAAKSEPHILESMNEKAKSKMMDRYADTKLLQILYIRQLAPAMTESAKPHVTLNCVCPGWAHSGILRERHDMGIRLSSKLMARSSEEGSRQLVQGVVDGHAETHGQYMTFGEIADVSKFVRSGAGEQISKKVYEELNAKLEQIQPGILGNI